MRFQFFYDRDYNRVCEGLEAVMGNPSREFSKRVSGPLGPAVRKTRASLWQGGDYSLDLRSDPGGNGISVLKFSVSSE
jgi:hypothetical protein